MKEVLLGELERGPGLLGFFAKHLLRAGELESIWEKGQAKNKAGGKQAYHVTQWKPSNSEIGQRNTKQVRNRP